MDDGMLTFKLLLFGMECLLGQMQVVLPMDHRTLCTNFSLMLLILDTVMLLIHVTELGVFSRS